MAFDVRLDAEGAVARIDNVSHCTATFDLGLAWVTFTDDLGNSVRVITDQSRVERLHACWAATAPAPIAQPTPLR